MPRFQRTIFQERPVHRKTRDIKKRDDARVCPKIGTHGGLLCQNRGYSAGIEGIWDTCPPFLPNATENQPPLQTEPELRLHRMTEARTVQSPSFLQHPSPVARGDIAWFELLLPWISFASRDPPKRNHQRNRSSHSRQQKRTNWHHIPLP